MSKIVIIEDNALIARLYENKLLAAKHSVRVAFDGISGLELIEEFSPQLVLLDLMMPGISGVEVIKKVRRNPVLTHVPIVAFSSADEEVLDSAREAGATRIVSKNEISSKEFFQQITELLESTRRWQVYGAEGDMATATSAREASSESRGRVLIVEDDKAISTIVKSIVERTGFETVVAEDGREAYRILADDANFAAGIFDVQMPFIKGPDLIRYMRTEKRLMRIPVMIMTSDESVRVQIESLSAGAAVFVPKPFEREAFESLFTGLMSRLNKETIVKF